jgi:hypothetical protein
MTHAPVLKLQVCNFSESITSSGTRNSASNHTPAGRLRRWSGERLPEPDPAAAGAYAPSVMGKKRLFHAFSSSWFLYW